MKRNIFDPMTINRKETFLHGLKVIRKQQGKKIWSTILIATLVLLTFIGAAFAIRDEIDAETDECTYDNMADETHSIDIENSAMLLHDIYVPKQKPQILIGIEPPPMLVDPNETRDEPESEEEVPVVIPRQAVIEELPEDVPEEKPAPPEPTAEEIMWENLGNDVIDTGIATLTRYELPSYYYPGIDFSSFQSYMPYTVITAKSSPAYKVTHSDRFYVDSNGLCRSSTYTDDGEFTIDRGDDYIIALGTYYKPKGTCGDRWLIITSTGAYTAITGDEKADEHTDPHHMYTDNPSYNGMIEFLVDYNTLVRSIKNAGTVTAGPIEAMHGEIQYIYKIE